MKDILATIHTENILPQRALATLSKQYTPEGQYTNTVPINPDHDRPFFHDAFEVLGLFGLGDKLGDVLTGLKDGFKKD